MPRRGWLTADVPAGWIQIVRGPRRRAEQWPRASATRSAVPRVASSVQAQPLKPILTSAKDKVNPDAARDAARNKVSKLEKALEVLGDSTGPAVDALKSELEKARQAVPPLNVQISSTQDFIRRSERRLAELEAERTAEAKLLEEGRERLRQLEAARCAQEGVASSLSATPLDLGTQVQTLQQMVTQLQEERDALTKEVQSGPVERPKVRQRLSVPHVAENTIPLMPTLVPRELSEWMENRQSDMQEAMSRGNLKKLLELTSLQGQAAERLAEMTGGMEFPAQFGECRGCRRPVSVERRQVWVERRTGRRSQQPRTSPPVPPPFRKFVGG